MSFRGNHHQRFTEVVVSRYFLFTFPLNVVNANIQLSLSIQNILWWKNMLWWRTKRRNVSNPKYLVRIICEYFCEVCSNSLNHFAVISCLLIEKNRASLPVHKVDNALQVESHDLCSKSHLNCISCTMLTSASHTRPFRVLANRQHSPWLKYRQ